MKTKPKLSESASITPEEKPGPSCSVEGGCPPSHRAARRISTFIICFLILSLLCCGGYMMWTQSL